MTPSLFHVPPRPDGASHSVCEGPPAASIFFSFPSAKKARNFPSADQNGKLAPSVSARFFASGAPTSYSQITSLRADSRYPTTATVWPFGATAISRAGNAKGAEKYIVCTDGDRTAPPGDPGQRADDDRGADHPREAHAQAPGAGCFGRSRRDPEPGLETAWSAKAMSRADWNRSAGFFSRQWRTMRCSAGETVRRRRGDLRRVLLQDRRHASRSPSRAGTRCRPASISYSTAPNEKMSER